MSGAIAEQMLEFVALLAGCVGRQPLQTDGLPRDVTTQHRDVVYFDFYVHLVHATTRFM